MNQIVGNLARILNLKSPGNIQSRGVASDGEHCSFHEGIQHAGFDGLVTRRLRAGVEEEHGGRCGTVMVVGVPEKCEAGFGRGDGLGHFRNGCRGCV